MGRRRVLVVGDVMLDEFLWGHVSRISPEAPVPVVEIQRESFHVGGAGNVAANVRALGARVVLAGVAGRDGAGERLFEALARAGVECAIHVPETRPTTVKTRIVAHHQQVVRADRESSRDLTGRDEDAVIGAALDALPGCDAVIVSDYEKGVVTSRLVRTLVSRAGRSRIPLLVDPKVSHLRRYRGATLVTPNQHEAALGAGQRIETAADLRTAGSRLLDLLRCQALLITRGEHGMALFEAGRRPLEIPTAAREVFDVTGAGDTVIATLGLAVAAGARLPVAAALANHAAGVVVGKLGTATATADELLAAVAGR
jgi:D-beta-D-heptose 7-phosphate kinase/D-beta-D-heptose 1-phosphate adenosyltransferase